MHQTKLFPVNSATIKNFALIKSLSQETVVHAFTQSHQKMVTRFGIASITTKNSTSTIKFEGVPTNVFFQI